MGAIGGRERLNICTLYTASGCILPFCFSEGLIGSRFHNSLIKPCKGSRDTAILSLQELPSSLPQQSRACQQPSTPTTPEPPDIDNKTGGRISGLARMCARRCVRCEAGEKVQEWTPVPTPPPPRVELGLYLVAILSRGGIKTDFMRAWRGIQRGSCTERKMYDDPRCHSHDFWTALVTRSVLQRRWRIVSPVMHHKWNVARTHSRE